MKSSELSPLLFTVYSAAALGRSPALPCFAALLVLVRFSGLFAFTQFIFQTRTLREFWLPFGIHAAVAVVMGVPVATHYQLNERRYRANPLKRPLQ